MKKIFNIVIIATLLSISIVCIVYSLLITHIASEDREYDMITNYCITAGIFSTNIDYRDIVKQANAVNEIFNFDIVDIYATIAKESEFHTNAVNTNWYYDYKGRKAHTVDMGLMQINTCWNGVPFEGIEIIKLKYKHITNCNNVMFNAYNNIFAGCYVMREKLSEADGDWKKSKVYYNGRGEKAEAYGHDVVNIYHKMNQLYRRKL